MKTRRVPLIIGLVLALGTAVLLLGYLTSLRPSGTAAQTRGVLVATRDIPARSAVTPDLFSVQQRIATQVDPDAISDPKDLAGTYTLVAIPAGGVATKSKIGLASAATLPARIDIGMLAVSIPIDSVKGVADLITPGDRVDVIATLPAVAGETPRGYAILRGIVVLAMGSNVDTAPAPASAPLAGLIPPTTATLEVTPSQADILIGADLGSNVRLALRNPKEAVNAFPTEPLRLALQAVPAAAAAPSHVAPVSAAAAPAVAHGAPSSRVIVIDGDHVDSGGTATR